METAELEKTIDSLVEKALATHLPPLIAKVREETRDSASGSGGSGGKCKVLPKKGMTSCDRALNKGSYLLETVQGERLVFDTTRVYNQLGRCINHRTKDANCTYHPPLMVRGKNYVNKSYKEGGRATL